eukprot:IDg6158t1
MPKLTAASLAGNKRAKKRKNGKISCDEDPKA